MDDVKFWIGDFNDFFWINVELIVEILRSFWKIEGIEVVIYLWFDELFWCLIVNYVYCLIFNILENILFFF